MFFRESTRDDTDYAGMPTAVRQDECGIIFGVKRVLDLVGGGTVDGAIDGVSVGIQFVDMRGKFSPAFGILGQQKLDTQTCLAKASCCI